MTSLKERYAKALALFEAGAAARAQDSDKLKNWAAAGKLKSDEDFLRVAIETARWMKFMDISAPALSKNNQLAEEYSRYAVSFPPAYERVNQIASEYDGMNPVDVRSAGGGSNLQLFLQEGEYQSIFDQAWRNLEAFGEPALARANEIVDKAVTTAQQALDAGDPGKLVGNKEIIGAQTYVESISAVYASRPDKEPGIVAGYKSLNGKVDEALGALVREAFGEIVAGNTPVEDKFQDADRAAIDRMARERWANAYPQDKIIEIRIPNEAWIRRSEPGWKNGLFVMLQYSIVTPYVVVEESDGLASLWGMVAEKDHLEGDEITLSFGRLRERQLDPRYVVLKSSLDN